MLNSEPPEIPLHDAPEVHHEPPGLTRMNVAEFNDYPRGYKATTSSNGHIQGQASKKLRERRKYGLSPIQLWMLLLLVTVLAVGAIKGGALGSRAIQPNHSNSASSTADNSNSGKTVTLISSATPDTVSASSLSIPSSTRGHTGCPTSNGTNYSSRYKSQFKIFCGMQWTGGTTKDLSDPPAANLEECMEQCALWNELYGPNVVCQVAVYQFTGRPKGWHDCWLKSVPQSPTLNPPIKDMSDASGLLL